MKGSDHVSDGDRRVGIHNINKDDDNDDDDDDFMEKKVIKVSPKREDPPAKPKTLKTPQSKTTSSPSKTRDRRTSSSSSSSSQAKTKEEKKEERYSWLVEIRDANERPQSHPDYDKTTLFIPQEAYNSMTGFEQQVGFFSFSFFVSFRVDH